MSASPYDAQSKHAHEPDPPTASSYTCPSCWRSPVAGIGFVRWWEGLVDLGPSWKCSTCIAELRHLADVDPRFGGIEVLQVRGELVEPKAPDGPTPKRSRPAARPAKRRPSRATVEV